MKKKPTSPSSRNVFNDKHEYVCSSTHTLYNVNYMENIITIYLFGWDNVCLSYICESKNAEE